MVLPPNSGNIPSFEEGTGTWFCQTLWPVADLSPQGWQMVPAGLDYYYRAVNEEGDPYAAPYLRSPSGNNDCAYFTVNGAAVGNVDCAGRVVVQLAVWGIEETDKGTPIYLRSGGIDYMRDVHLPTFAQGTGLVYSKPWNRNPNGNVPWDDDSLSSLSIGILNEEQFRLLFEDMGVTYDD